MAITQVRLYTGLLADKKVIGLNSIDRSASWYYATLMIKRPCFIGSSMWEFKSIERNHSFSASIEHESWLKEYQDRNLGHLDPGDGLIALVSYDAVKKKGIKGFKHRNEKILHVERIIRASEIQLVIEEINSSEK